MGGSSHRKKVRGLKCKIFQQASKHVQVVERYEKEIQELKYGRDIMKLYSAMPCNTFTTPMETKDVFTILTRIKKWKMAFFLLFMS